MAKIHNKSLVLLNTITFYLLFVLYLYQFEDVDQVNIENVVAFNWKFFFLGILV